MKNIITSIFISVFISFISTFFLLHSSFLNIIHPPEVTNVGGVMIMQTGDFPFLTIKDYVEIFIPFFIVYFVLILVIRRIILRYHRK